jgi:hypothetical protein
MARRRLAAIAATNSRVQEALAPAGFSGLLNGEMAASAGPRDLEASSALQLQLDLLAQDIVATPGAGGALLAAYAAQARALTMVVEASKRAGMGPLPQAVVSAAEAALAAPIALMGLPVV